MLSEGGEKVALAEENERLAEERACAAQVRIQALERELGELTSVAERLKKDMAVNNDETLKYQAAAEAQIIALNQQNEQHEERFAQVQQIIAKMTDDAENARQTIARLESQLSFATDSAAAAASELAAATNRFAEETNEREARIATAIRQYKSERDAERDALVAENRALLEENDRHAAARAEMEARAQANDAPIAEEEEEEEQAPAADFANANDHMEMQDVEDGAAQQCLWWTRNGERHDARPCAGAVADRFLHRLGAFKLCQQHTCSRGDEGCRLLIRTIGRRCSACSRTGDGKERIKKYDSRRHKRVHY